MFKTLICLSLQMKNCVLTIWAILSDLKLFLWPKNDKKCEFWNFETPPKSNFQLFGVFCFAGSSWNNTWKNHTTLSCSLSFNMGKPLNSQENPKYFENSTNIFDSGDAIVISVKNDLESVCGYTVLGCVITIILLHCVIEYTCMHTHHFLKSNKKAVCTRCLKISYKIGE